MMSQGGRKIYREGWQRNRRLFRRGGPRKLQSFRRGGVIVIQAAGPPMSGDPRDAHKRAKVTNMAAGE